MSRLFISLIFLLFLFTSCEKTVSFAPGNAAPRLVVDATIENGQPPVVMLTNSFNFFSEISADLLLNAFVHNAVVTISDGSNIYPLKETHYDLAADAKIYYYTVDSIAGEPLFRGEFKKSYSLEIKSGGTTYNAVTSIPALTKLIDSIWWKKAPFAKDTTKVVLMAKVKDPPGLGNYIRYFTKVNKDPFFPGFTSAFDDQIIDGTTYDIEIERGVDRNAEIDLQEYSFFHSGDTVTVKFTNIDKATFDFWRTMEYSYSSIGNPFSSPTKVLGNISSGALGYFGGYAAQFKSIVIPK